MTKKELQLKTDRYLLAQAFRISAHSVAVRLKVGALLADGHNEILGVGYNHTSDGYSKVCEKAISINGEVMIPASPGEAQMLKDMDCPLVTNEFVIHAEATALMEALKHGARIDGCTMYVTDEPCAECAKLIVASGIKRVVYSREYRLHKGTEILEKGGVELICIPLSEEDLTILWREWDIM